MNYRPVVNNNGHRPMPAGDTLAPDTMPIAGNSGNQVVTTPTGLYVGVGDSTPISIYVDSVSGIDSMDRGSSAAPLKTLDYALTVGNLVDPTGRGLSRLGAVVNILLRVSQTFALTKSVEINGITLRFGFYGDPRGQWDTPINNTILSVIEDVVRPRINNVMVTNPTTGMVEATRIYQKSHAWPSTVELQGVQLNIGETASTNLGVVDFVDGPNLSIVGSIINKTGLSAPGLLAVRSDRNITLREFASQFRITNRLINKPQGQDSITFDDLEARVLFIKFYLGAGGANYRWENVQLNPQSLNSSNASGMLTLLWEDSIRQSSGSTYSLASYPQMSELNFGIARYITNLRKDQQGRPLNVLGGRLI